MDTFNYTPESHFEHDSKLLLQYVIYKNPRDYPGKFVARQWSILGSGVEKKAAFVCDNLDQARSCIPSWLYRMDRMQGDDPAILEVWL